jgi:Protein of unknown function (DUF3341)
MNAATQAKAPKLWGLLAQYENPAEIYHAAEQVKGAGYAQWDCCVPFPVHGLDKVMGVKASPLPWFVLAIGISGRWARSAPTKSGCIHSSSLASR